MLYEVITMMRSRREQGRVQFGGEAGPVAQHFGFCKRINKDDHDGQIQHKQYHPQVGLRQNSFYHSPPPSFELSLSSVLKTDVAAISSSIISESAAP